MTLTAGRYAIEKVDLTTVSDDELRPVAELRRRLDHERSPDDPLAPIELIERRLRNRPPAREWNEWVARDGDEVVGYANAIQLKHIENPHWREAIIGIRRDHRRQGLGTAMLRAIVDAHTHDDEAVFATYTSTFVPGAADFAKAAGMAAGLETRTSEVRFADIDRALMREWASIDPAGYRLAWIDTTDTPDALMNNVVQAYNAMNTAPRGSLSFGDENATPEQIREWEAMRRKNGGERRLLLAIDEATGDTAGYTEVGRHPQTPWIVGQNGTAVIPAHRGRGIGKWLKARMIERVVADWPEATKIRTGNAYENAPMLSINDRMGFRVTHSVTIWEGKLRDLREYVGRR